MNNTPVEAAGFTINCRANYSDRREESVF